EWNTASRSSRRAWNGKTKEETIRGKDFSITAMPSTATRMGSMFLSRQPRAKGRRFGFGVKATFRCLPRNNPIRHVIPSTRTTDSTHRSMPQLANQYQFQDEGG